MAPSPKSLLTSLGRQLHPSNFVVPTSPSTKEKSHVSDDERYYDAPKPSYLYPANPAFTEEDKGPRGGILMNKKRVRSRGMSGSFSSGVNELSDSAEQTNGLNLALAAEGVKSPTSEPGELSPSESEKGLNGATISSPSLSESSQGNVPSTAPSSVGSPSRPALKPDTFDPPPELDENQPQQGSGLQSGPRPRPPLSATGGGRRPTRPPSIHFAPLPKSDRPRSNSITLGVSARASLLAGNANLSGDGHQRRASYSGAGVAAEETVGLADVLDEKVDEDTSEDKDAEKGDGDDEETLDEDEVKTEARYEAEEERSRSHEKVSVKTSSPSSFTSSPLRSQSPLSTDGERSLSPPARRSSNKPEGVVTVGEGMRGLKKVLRRWSSGGSNGKKKLGLEDVTADDKALGQHPTSPGRSTEGFTIPEEEEEDATGGQSTPRKVVTTEPDMKKALAERDNDVAIDDEEEDDDGDTGLCKQPTQSPNAGLPPLPDPFAPATMIRRESAADKPSRREFLEQQQRKLAGDEKEQVVKPRNEEKEEWGGKGARPREEEEEEEELASVQGSKDEEDEDEDEEARKALERSKSVRGASVEVFHKHRASE